MTSPLITYKLIKMRNFSIGFWQYRNMAKDCWLRFHSYICIYMFFFFWPICLWFVCFWGFFFFFLYFYILLFLLCIDCNCLLGLANFWGGFNWLFCHCPISVHFLCKKISTVQITSQSCFPLSNSYSETHTLLES